jgi:hypothetical protein
MPLCWCWSIKVSLSRHKDSPSRSNSFVDSAPYATSNNTSGCRLAILSNTFAGPVGERRPCSQFCSVSALMPSTAANLDCDKPSRPRTFTKSVLGFTRKVRAGLSSPFSMACACFTLSSSSSKSSFFTASIGFSAISVDRQSNHPFRFSDTAAASKSGLWPPTSNKSPAVHRVCPGHCPPSAVSAFHPNP